MTHATYKGWTREQAAQAIANLPGYDSCMSHFGTDIDGNYNPEQAQVDFEEAVDILEQEGVRLPKLEEVVTATVLESSTSRRLALLARQSQLLQELQQIGAELLQLELEQPQPQPQPKSVSQTKAENNARIAQANKGKSVKEKAEALDVPVATVRKVEKAKAATKVPVPATDKPMNTAAMKKLAKELGVSYEGIKFTSSKAREQFRATLAQAQANHDAKVWEGLSPSRQAKLTNTPSLDPNRASARAIAI